jgi:putative transcriptional regulator
MNSLQGQLLVASPDLLDPNFVKTVVLMVQHSDQGALGLVLNRPTKTTVKEALAQVDDTPCLREELLGMGGPCQGSLMAVHTRAQLKEVEILPNVFFSAESEHLEALVATDEGPARFFVGFAGWGPGQLEGEMETGSWRTAAADADLIFEGGREAWQGHRLWEQITKQIASSVLRSALNIKHRPSDPSMN